MARYYFGQIVAAWIDDGKGRTKKRPVLIIDDDEDYEQTGEIQVIFISTKRSNPCPYYHIKVHSTTKRDAYTGLSEPCWAKCNIASNIEVRRLGSTIGHMPDHLLKRIVDVYDRIYDDPHFDDWQ